MKLKNIFIAGILIFSTTPAIADTSIGVKVGTLGYGLEMTTNVVPMLLNVRVVGSGFNYSTGEIKEADVTYDGTLNLRTAGAILDLYPFAGKFRISGGLLYNGNKITLDAQVAQDLIFNGVTYRIEDLGTVNAEVTFNSYAPYVGIGFGDSVSSGSPLGFSIEVGAVYQGIPKTSITASSPIPGLADQFAADVAVEEAKLDDKLKNYKYYPVVAVGMSYRF